MSIESPASTATLVPNRDTHVNIALVGNPNCGKTTLFNALTGLRQKVGNYPGVTVERKTGRIRLSEIDHASLLDLPGLYSLTPHSPDEVIARETLLGLNPNVPAPDVIVNVVDSSNLERNLYLTSQLLDIGIPIVIALTMADMLEKRGDSFDFDVLAKAIDCPVVRVVAIHGEGLEALSEAVQRAVGVKAPEPAWIVPKAIGLELPGLQTALSQDQGVTRRVAFAESISLLMQEHEPSAGPQLSPKLKEQLEQVRERIAETGTDLSSSIIESRYEWIRSVMAKTDPKGPTHENEPPGATAKVDRIVMHPVFGYMLFLFVMALIFQAIFTWAKYPMDWIKTAMDWAGGLLVNHMPAGDLRDLIKDGVLGGVGTTITFLPQILLLFFFISLLEDTGYMSRAAFLMDKLMSKVGLHGRSFIPLLSSFACAIPGIMATRTISNRKARLITILIAPLMSCSARIPVYALMIGAFIPAKAVISIGGHGIVHLPGLVLLSMYVLGMVFAFLFALLFHRTLLKGDAPIFLMELPPYRLPSLKTACLQMIERAWQFVYRAGTMILAISVVLWALTTYPKHPELPEGQRKQYSFVGNAGRFIEPVLKPMGFDWKMGIGIIASFAAREVFVSAMGTVYNVDATDDKGKVDLQSRMRADVDPTTGKPVYTPLVAICVMIYYVLAMQCMSTVVVVRRETGTWSWPLFQIAYMTGLAWVVTTVVYQVGRFAGWG